MVLPFGNQQLRHLPEGYILVLTANRRQITKFYAPGLVENITVRGEELGFVMILNKPFTALTALQEKFNLAF